MARKKTAADLSRQQLKQKVTGEMLERAQGRAKRLGVNLKGPVSRREAIGLRQQVAAKRAGTAPAGEGARPFDRPGSTGGVKGQVAKEIASRTRARARRLGLPAAGPVTKETAREMLERMRAAKGVTVGPKGKKSFDRSAPSPGGHQRAEKLTMLGIKGENVVEQGPGAERKGQQYRVGFDPLRQRYAHVYGEGEQQQRKYLRKQNPWTALYGKPQKAKARVAARRKKGPISPIGT